MWQGMPIFRRSEATPNVFPERGNSDTGLVGSHPELREAVAHVVAADVSQARSSVDEPWEQHRARYWSCQGAAEWQRTGCHGKAMVRRTGRRAGLAAA
ncbi:hypothetical protein CMUS01_03577 [Colletotrichum musicola]|uniref:Uncharacterized protein n=1 Tax=Colletotrichum musicola TaxID=2175873 RepID=A0A8H6NRR6_9PEZI|nr:hypothetical protein CMUS01_03577 [Colletotrichum musicola]